MKFDIHQRTFPSAAHHSIRNAALFLAPFRVVIPPEVRGAAADRLRKGERRLYRFVEELYADMYAHPEAYAIPAGVYDRFMDGRDRRSVAKKDAGRESSLRNQFQQAIQFYPKLLYEIGSRGEIQPGNTTVRLPARVFTDMLHAHRLTSVRGEQERRAKALERVGMIVRRSSNAVTVSFPDSPYLLNALSMLCRSGGKRYSLTNFLRCDFRGLLPSFQPGAEDAMAALSDDIRPALMKIDESMERLSCKVKIEPLKNTTLHSTWKAAYTLRGKSLYGFHGNPDEVNVFAYFNKPINVSRMGSLVRENSGDLHAWFFDHIPARNCACRNNRSVDIGGRKKRICGLMNRLEASNPKGRDMRNLRRVIMLYHDGILQSSGAAAG